MNYEFIKVQYEEKHILRNMLEIYTHDMSEFDDGNGRLDLNDSGLYGYRYLDHYWTEAGRAAYLVYADKKLAGFVMIRTMDMDQHVYEIAEFFVLRKYRKSGLGKYMTAQVFDKYRGKWIINTPVRNGIARIFWTKIANQNAYMGNIKESIIEDGTRVQWEFEVR